MIVVLYVSVVLMAAYAYLLCLVMPVGGWAARRDTRVMSWTPSDSELGPREGAKSLYLTGVEFSLLLHTIKLYPTVSTS